MLEAKYGLPSEVKFCTRCVISNCRPSSTIEYSHTAASKKETIHFDEEGVCDACRVAEAKAKTDWDKRKMELSALCDRHRSRTGAFDCIVPGSGGKDSFYAAHRLKEDFGMHPLTVTWAPHIPTDWGQRNFRRWNETATNILYTPNVGVHRLLTRLAVENLFHPFQPFIIGQKSLAPKLAALYRIPLVFYGENEAEYGNPIESNGRKRGHYFSSDIHLGGISESELRYQYGLADSDLEPYKPAYPEDLDRIGVEVHYLGYYLRWHPQSAYYYAVQHGGFEAAPERTPGTYSKYNSIDDKIDDLHYYTTWIKFGIGRATYDAAQEIRSGDITREEGVALVKRFDGEWPARFEREIFDYLSCDGFAPMRKPEFLALAERFKSSHLWEGNRLRHTVYESVTADTPA
jgi:N-acetyl sugar amidotransferase